MPAAIRSPKESPAADHTFLVELRHGVGGANGSQFVDGDFGRQVLTQDRDQFDPFTKIGGQVKNAFRVEFGRREQEAAGAVCRRKAQLSRPLFRRLQQCDHGTGERMYGRSAARSDGPAQHFLLAAPPPAEAALADGSPPAPDNIAAQAIAPAIMRNWRIAFMNGSNLFFLWVHILNLVRQTYT